MKIKNSWNHHLAILCVPFEISWNFQRSWNFRGSSVCTEVHPNRSWEPSTRIAVHGCTAASEKCQQSHPTSYSNRKIGGGNTSWKRFRFSLPTGHFFWGAIIHLGGFPNMNDFQWFLLVHHHPHPEVTLIEIAKSRNSRTAGPTACLICASLFSWRDEVLWPKLEKEEMEYIVSINCYIYIYYVILYYIILYYIK